MVVYWLDYLCANTSSRYIDDSEKRRTEIGIIRQLKIGKHVFDLNMNRFRKTIVVRMGEFATSFRSKNL
jgi:hypothetical protein